MLALASGLSRGLNPLAHAGALVHGGEEAKETALGVGAVVLAHNRTDGVRSLVGVVKGNGRDVVVEDVRLDDAMKKVTADEATLAINGSSSTTDKVPLFGVIVGESRVGVLEKGDGDYC